MSWHSFRDDETHVPPQTPQRALLHTSASSNDSPGSAGSSPPADEAPPESVDTAPNCFYVTVSTSSPHQNKPLSEVKEVLLGLQDTTIIHEGMTK